MAQLNRLGQQVNSTLVGIIIGVVTTIIGFSLAPDVADAVSDARDSNGYNATSHQWQAISDGGERFSSLADLVIRTLFIFYLLELFALPFITIKRSNDLSLIGGIVGSVIALMVALQLSPEVFKAVINTYGKVEQEDIGLGADIIAKLSVMAYPLALMGLGFGVGKVAGTKIGTGLKQ